MSPLESSPNSSNFVRQELGPGERLVWIDKPDPVLFARATSSWVNIAVGIFGIVFLLFVTWVITNADNIQVPLFVILLFLIPLFVLVGVYLCSPLLSYFQGTRAIYAITNDRILVIEDYRGLSVESYHQQDIGQVYRRDSENGFGSVIFSSSTSEDHEGNTISEEIGFYGVQNAQEVERLINDLKNRSQI